MAGATRRRSRFHPLDGGIRPVRPVSLTRARAIRLDVTDPDQITTVVADIGADIGRLDVLVNNAAIHYDTWQTASAPDFDVIHDALATNRFGAWQLTIAALPLLRNSSRGRIVNVSSGAGALSDMGGGGGFFRDRRPIPW